MKNFDTIKTQNIPFDARGIEYPRNYLWALGNRAEQGEANQHHPKFEIVKYLTISHNDYDDNYTFECRCIQTNTNNNSVSYFDYNGVVTLPRNPQESRDGVKNLEWLWNGSDDDVPQYWEECEEHIIDMVVLYDFDQLKKNKFDGRIEEADHLIKMVALVDELEGVDIVDLERDMPSLYEQFVKAKKFVQTKLLTLVIIGCLFTSCTFADKSQGMTESEWATLEVINDLEDAKEYMISDIEEGRLPSDRGYTYLLIIDESIDNLTNLKTK